MQGKKETKDLIKVKNIKTGEIFKTTLDIDMLKLVPGIRRVEVTDSTGNKRAFRRDFLELIV